MFEDRFSLNNGQAGAATVDPQSNGKAAKKPLPQPSTNGKTAPNAGRRVPAPSANGANGAAAHVGNVRHDGAANGGSPSPNGESTAPPQAAAATGRAANGQFAKGNRGGPGNPFARQSAELRQALLDRTTPADVEEIAGKLIEQAKAGDVQSAKLVFQYTIGKPQPAPNPDDLDVQEWQGFQREAGMMGQVQSVLGAPAPELPLTMVRIARPDVTDSMSTMVANLMAAPPAEGRDFLDRTQGMPAAEQTLEMAKLGRPLDVADHVQRARDMENRRERRARRRKERKNRPSPNGK